MAAPTPYPAPPMSPAPVQPRRVPVLTVWIDGARTSPAIGDRCTCTPTPA